MPRILIRDAYGQGYAIDTLDWAKIGPWLTEWLQRLADPNPAIPPPQLEIRPSWDAAGNKPDLPFSGKSYVLNQAGARLVLKELAEALGVEIAFPVLRDA